MGKQNRHFASVVEMVDTSDLKSDGCIAVPVQVRPEALLHNEHNSVVGVKLPRAGGLLVSRKGAVTELVTLEGQWWVFINQEQDSSRTFISRSELFTRELSRRGGNIAGHKSSRARGTGMCLHASSRSHLDRSTRAIGIHQHYRLPDLGSVVESSRAEEEKRVMHHS